MSTVRGAPSRSTTMSNSFDAKEANYVREGEVKLPTFQSRFFDGSNKLPVEWVREMVSVEKTVHEFYTCGIPERFHDPDREAEAQLKNEVNEKLVCYLLGRTYPGPELKVLISNSRWLKPLCEGLVANPAKVTLLHLHFSGSDRHSAESLQYILTLLEESPYERGLQISSSYALPAGCEKYIAQAVCTNKLHKLDVSEIGGGSRVERQWFYAFAFQSGEIADALMLNTSLETVAIDAHPSILKSLELRAKNSKTQPLKNLTLVLTFSTAEWNLGGSAESLTAVLTSNPALEKIYLQDADFPQSIWMQIVDSMKVVTNLQVLHLGGSFRWDFQEFLDALLDLIRLHCTQIVDLGLKDLSQKDLRKSIILREFLPVLNEQLRLNTEYGQALRDVPKGPPRCARVVLCGPGYAGKTSLCKTMLRKRRSRLRHNISLFLQKRPRLWRLLYGPDAEIELEKRTRGVDMHLWKDEEDLRISLWDFAGQKEYYALHDYVLPNVNSANLFLFTFSLVPSPFDSRAGNSNSDASRSARISEIEKELGFWLRFLCSNCKEFIDPKPRVRIVLTNSDRVKDLGDWNFMIVEVLERFRSFTDRLDLVFEDEMSLINTHSQKMVWELENKILEDFHRIMPNLEPTFTICEAVRKNLRERMCSSPVINIEEYYRICREVDERMLHDTKVKQAVASYLHSVGELIYFEELRFMVINPRWLGVGILGNLLHVFGRTSAAKFRGLVGSCSCKGRSYQLRRISLENSNGFVTRKGLKSLLRESLRSVTYAKNKCHIGPDDLIALMLALEICYEDKDRGGYLIPAAFDDVEEMAARGLRRLEWRPVQNPGPYIFIGRRLQCADQDRTFLTPGFFPRLQVALRKHLLEKDIIGERRELGSFEVDRNLLRFMHNTMDIIVEYAEGEHFRGNFVDVLVKTLLSHASTRNFIEEHVLSVIRKFCAQPEGNQGVKLVEGIIRPKAVEALVLCKYREDQAVLVSDLERHLKDDRSYRFYYNAVSDQANLPRLSTLRRPEYAYALDAIEGEGFHARFQGNETSADMSSTPEISTTLSASRYQDFSDNPKMFYLVEDNAGLQTPFTSEPRLRLYLQCEWRDGPHVVEGQRGRSFVFSGKAREIIMPLVQSMYGTCKLAAVLVARSVPFLGALEVGVTMLPAKIRESACAAFDQNTIKSLVGDNTEDIVRSYEEILKATPYCEWLTNFFDIRDEVRFESDFKLKKARYKDTKEIAFLCRDCWRKGFSRHCEVLQFP